MKIIKKPSDSLQREDAHNGAGGRKMLLSDGEIGGSEIEAMTYGYLPAGKEFDWHSHLDIDEAMFVINGEGVVADREGEYEYQPGDLFIFPSGVEHIIKNLTEEEHEYIFLRLKK